MINSKGSVLIEAIVATVIIAISLTLIIQSLLGSYKGLNVQRDYTRAMNELENKVYALWFGTSDPNNSLGSSEDISIEAKSDDINENLKKQSLVASWVSGKKQNQISAVTFTYNPPNDQKQDSQS